MRENHSGPKFEEVKSMHPNAISFHWHQNAFNTEDCYWIIGFRAETSNGQSCTVYVNIKV